MFTQEQLGALKGVVVEAVKPLLEGLEEIVDKKLFGLEKRIDGKLEGLENRLIERVDERFYKMDEKLDFLDKKMDRGFEKVTVDINYMKGDIAILLDTTEDTQEKVVEIGGTMLVVQDDLRRLKANSSI